MTAVTVIVTVTSSASLSEVKSACEAHGLTHIQQMQNFPIFTGIIEDERVVELRKIPNIKEVEIQRINRTLTDGIETVD
jgi:hypothetical protein